MVFANSCPVCGGPAVMTCRCLKGDSSCSKGHHWHRCLVHNKIVIGHSSHGTSGCTCPEPEKKTHCRKERMMPPPNLVNEQEILISQMIETFLAGSKEYPKSQSDMKWGMMAVLRMFEIKRRPIAIDLKIVADDRP